MGLRFHRVFSVLPGVRINVSKSGVSTSVGPRGADVNIGRHGVTTNAGIPGTGLSYRQKMGSRGSKLGIIALVGALAFAAFKSADKIIALFHPSASTTDASVAHRTASAAATKSIVSAAKPITGVRYVHRGGSDLPALPKTSAKVLKKEPKGQQVQLIAISGAWAEVRDGQLSGWMRASVLGEAPPQ
ncbi:MAG TPA: DUF4236 domain-containing protein [Rhizomicrobium sp.]|jgi:hypothetical protein|nr:DUF4236 domain-containing protein [Rhizomicrobium sp.]